MQDMGTAKEIDFADLEKSRSFRMFRQAIKSDKTFYSYRYTLREFLKYANLSSFDEITTAEPNVIQGILENWIMDLSAKGIKGSTIRVKLAREKVSSVYDTHSTGVPCDMWTCSRSMFFYPSIILIGIISSIVIFVLFIKSRGSFKKIK